MEETERALTEETIVPPFSELISRWLEEGERLSEDMSTSRMAAATRAETPFRQALQRLRAGVERHRLAALVGAGLLPVALFLATQHPSAQHGAPVPVVLASARALSPSPAGRLPPAAVHAPGVVAPSAHQAVVAAPKPHPVLRRPAVAVRKTPRAARRVGAAVSKAPRAARPTAVAVSKAPPVARPAAVIGPPAPPVVRQIALAGPKAPPVARRATGAGPQAPPLARRITVASPKAPGYRPVQ